MGTENSKPSFSLHEFKDWLSAQKDLSDFFNIDRDEDPKDTLIGREVTPKVSEKKLLQKIKAEHGEPVDLVTDLLESGGTITDTEGKNLLVEVESGSFYIPRFCVKLVKLEE